MQLGHSELSKHANRPHHGAWKPTIFSLLESKSRKSQRRSRVQEIKQRQTFAASLKEFDHFGAGCLAAAGGGANVSESSLKLPKTYRNEAIPPNMAP